MLANNFNDLHWENWHRVSHAQVTVYENNRIFYVSIMCVARPPGHWDVYRVCPEGTTHFPYQVPDRQSAKELAVKMLEQRYN